MNGLSEKWPAAAGIPVSPPGGREQPLKRVGGRVAPGPVHFMVAAVMWNDKPGAKAFGIMVQPVMSTARCTGLLGCPKSVRAY